MNKSKIKKYMDVMEWSYSSPPNNMIDGIMSVSRLLYWTIILKRFKKLFIGKYFKLDFFFDTKSDGCAALYSNPYPEYTLHKLLEFWMKPKNVLVDIGSNVGYYPLIAASLGSEVHSFEPNYDVLRIQRINLHVNSLEKLVCTNNKAVSDKDETATFYLQDKSHSLVSSLLFDYAKHAKKTKIECVKLDSYVKENKIEKIDFLIIDVEGAESKVIAGAKNILEKGKVKIISWETNEQGTKSDRNDVIDILSQYGYKHFAFDVKGKTVKPRVWKYGDANCISVHRSSLKDFKKFKIS